ncbi:MAG: hypothetical protein FOGNACKC_05497 [Anaerolineae bacterium]|nr:hypothetical protein [Anaerolineae bacterium]
MAVVNLNRTCVADWLEFTRRLPDESVDLYLSDPAYDSLNRWAGVGTTARMGLGRNGSGSDDPTKLFPTISNEDLPLLLTEVYRVLKPERHAYIMCDFPTLFLLWRHAIEDGLFGVYDCSGVTVPRGKALVWSGGEDEIGFGAMLHIAEAWVERLRNGERVETSRLLATELFETLAAVWGSWPATPLVWDKIAAGMGYSYRAAHEYILFLWKGKKRRLNDLGIRDVLRYQRVAPSRAVVPTQKPDLLFETLVRQSTQPGELVLDNFMGSGTTARACAATGRNWLGCDLNPEHVALANAVQIQMVA